MPRCKSVMMNTSEVSFDFPAGTFESIVFETRGASELKRLRPLHYEIISMHLAGVRNKDIARQLDCTKATVVNIIHSRLGREAIEGALEKYYDEFQELAPKVVQVVEDTLDNEDNPDLRLRAAGMWIKTSGWEQRRKTVQTSEDQVKNILIQANNVQMNG